MTPPVVTLLATAREYISKGLCVIPVAYREKKPTLTGWPSLRISAEEAPTHFGNGPINIGVHLGEPSAWIVDVDLDCAEAVLMAGHLFPQTCTFGRPTTGESHRLYRVAEGIESATWSDPLAKQDGCLLELRATNHQTVFPPSIHLGNPHEDAVSTSFVERQNLTMRMGMRRFTRLTNGFSKKIENHRHSVAVHFMHYNFCRAHSTLTKAHAHHYPTTPAMAAGLADHVWTLEELCGRLDPTRLLQ